MTFQLANLIHSDTKIFARSPWSNFFLAFGIITTLFGLLTAFGFGLAILLFSPLWFILAAALHPTLPRLGAALFVMGCWSYAAFLVAT